MELDTEQVYVPQITLGSDESYSFYNQLDDNNKAAYDAIESAWTEPNVTTVKYALTDKVTYKVESTDTSTWTEEQTAEFWNLVFATFQSGETAFMYDYPEVFWYKRNEIAVSISMSSGSPRGTSSPTAPSMWTRPSGTTTARSSWSRVWPTRRSCRRIRSMPRKYMRTRPWSPSTGTPTASTTISTKWWKR